MDTVFANCSEDIEIYPLMTAEIAEAQQADATYKIYLSTMQLLIKD